MKRLIYLLLLLCFLTSCSSLPNQDQEDQEEIRTALRLVIQAASERIEAPIFSQLDLATLIPPSSDSLVSQEQIPRLQEHLELWQRQVLAAFRMATIAMPPLLKPYSESLAILDPVAVMQRSVESATALLAETYQQEIEDEVTTMLQQYLLTSTETWDMLTDRYAIWSRAQSNLGQQSLPPLGPDPVDHLIALFMTSYQQELTREEIYLRTTPTFQGTGSLYEILSKKDKP